MKKIWIILMFLLLLPVLSNARFEIEGVGGASYILMGKYNDDMNNTLDDYKNLGFGTDANNLNIGYGGTSVLLTTYSSPVGIMGTYFVTEIISAPNNIKIYWPASSYPSEPLFEETEEDWSSYYIGIGQRRYFNTEYSILSIIPFIGIDCGLGYPAAGANITKTQFYDTSGATAEYAEVSNLSGVYFGMRVEAGLELWVTNWLGFSAIGGMRYMKGSVEGTLNTMDNIIEDGSRFDQELDYTGGYIHLGIKFGFGDFETKKDDSKVTSESEYNKAIEYGDNEYSAGNYAKALQHYKRAERFSKNAKIYKKIGLCYYYLKNKKEAVSYLKLSLELNPRDTQLAEWLKKYK